MNIDRDQHMLIITSRTAMARQVRDALAVIKAANGGTDPPTIRAAYDVDPAAFSRVIEGMVALGASVDADLIELAGLRPVDQVLW